MARPPLPIGTYGTIRTYRTPAGWRARTTYRDYDGVTREVQRHGPTKAKAERALAEAIRTAPAMTAARRSRLTCESSPSLRRGFETCRPATVPRRPWLSTA